MPELVFVSNLSKFLRKSDQFRDMVMGNMTLDIEVFLKTQSGMPVKTGQMKSQVRHFKTSDKSYRVEADAEYSAVQEAGQRMSGPGAPTAKFTNYTTGGTSAGWFGRSVLAIVKNKENYIKQAARALGL